MWSHSFQGKAKLAPGRASMTTRGRYLRLHVCIDNRRTLAQRLFNGAATERSGNFPWPYPQPQCSVHRPNSIKSFASNAAGNLPEHLVGLLVITIQFMSEIPPRSQFAYFQPRWLRIFAPQRTVNAKIVSIVLKPNLVGYILCLNCVFHVLVPPRVSPEPD